MPTAPAPAPAPTAAPARAPAPAPKPAAARPPPAASPVDLLRFNTCGSVDDGKSTLIGRLLYDAKALMEDQLEALHATATADAPGQYDLAMLTDGLRAEREQGITIDVAYRYFATPRRRFIVADTPGHVQYTRNMVTGASTAALSVILVDARHGVVEQTRRHLGIAGLLRIPHVVVAINKMDLMGWNAARYREIRAELEGFLPRLGLHDVAFIPLSALGGDNVVDPSPHTPWYPGPPLLAHLENVHLGGDQRLDLPFRLAVQWVNRPHRPGDDTLHDFRGCSGQIASGLVRPGMDVVVLPAALPTRVRAVHGLDGPVEVAFAPQSVTLELEDDVDVGRGALLAGREDLPGVGTDLRAEVCWMHPRSLATGRRLLLKHGTLTTPVLVTEVASRLDLATCESTPAPAGLALNDIGRVRLRTAQPLAYDGYAVNRATGAFILIEPGTHATVAAGMLDAPPHAVEVAPVDYAI